MSLSSTFLVAASSGSLVDCPLWSAYPTAAPIRERTCLASPTNGTTDWESTTRPASGRAYPQTVSNITTDSRHLGRTPSVIPNLASGGRTGPGILWLLHNLSGRIRVKN